MVMRIMLTYDYFLFSLATKFQRGIGFSPCLTNSQKTLCSTCLGNVSEHRQILQEVFPNLMLRPKHHFVEHYPHLIRCFGPLVHLWTMRFEGKHRVFKKDTTWHKQLQKCFKNLCRETSTDDDVLLIVTKIFQTTSWDVQSQIGLHWYISLRGTSQCFKVY